VTYLLAFFNPTIRSLRTIEDFSQAAVDVFRIDDGQHWSSGCEKRSEPTPTSAGAISLAASSHGS